MLRTQDIPERFNVTSYFVDRQLAEGHGDRTALITATGPVGYAELAGLTNRVGNVLRELGVRRRGQRVLLALSDGVEFVASWYAVQKIGAVTAEAYTYLQPKDYQYFLEYTRTELAIVDTVTLDLVRTALTGTRRAVQLLVVGADGVELRDNEHDFAALVTAAPDTLDAHPTERDGIAIWKFTTGSTGAPKACVLPARAPRLSFDWYARGVLDLRADDVVLPVPKLFFGYARDLAALFPFGVGAAGIVFPERSTTERIFALIAEHRPTILVNVPTMMSAMVAHPAAAEQDLSCLRLCTSAGEALPAELLRKWDRTFGVEVVEGIGSSEAYHIYISNRPGETRPGSCGRVVPGYAARIVGLDGAELPDGEVGLLEVTGDTVAYGYQDDPDASDETFHGNTVRSRDLFTREADGFFRYRGRSDDLMKISGVWVAPSEIEDCLIGHPDVLECAVLGGEFGGLTVLIGYVVPRPGADPTPAELHGYLRDRLAGHKCPKRFRFVADLPRTTNGKLDRRALRAMVEQESS
ncbi:MAG TPA: benzoate-CoA ligase family protein [Actinophytocola sp.]|uniref:benzoate-CoA ligase family protein n=1 Tax=Actinophytocola sp. TaxID=1872138 RepID=UPI002DBA1D73|nr:benzoate-CoA ligase family protein [Actinophytocola sp.]HEU5470394.1 benzoate-CoA ligase family protein [Actinophytocola sp.]